MQCIGWNIVIKCVKVTEIFSVRLSINIYIPRDSSIEVTLSI